MHNRSFVNSWNNKVKSVSFAVTIMNCTIMHKQGGVRKKILHSLVIRVSSEGFMTYQAMYSCRLEKGRSVYRLRAQNPVKTFALLFTRLMIFCGLSISGPQKLPLKIGVWNVSLFEL